MFYICFNVAFISFSGRRSPHVHRLPLNPYIIIAAETHPSRVHIMYIISYISEIIAKLLEIFEIQHNKTCFHLFLLFSICFHIRALYYHIFNVFSHPKMYPKTKTTKKNIKFSLIFFFAMVAGDPTCTSLAVESVYHNSS